ncbi:MAG: hypothetical protein EXX96DRAFT_608951 [Benjaminiella poitrasii]|nr:MAG: hypothetical protein EXX96DRAFT_608951 [Benjaminiella poitrasii]
MVTVSQTTNTSSTHTSTDKDTTWKLDFNTLSNLPDNRFLQELIKESNNTEIPKEYHSFLSRIIQDHEASQKLIDETKNECRRKIITVYDQYRVLEGMLKKEYVHVMELSDAKAQLEMKIQAQHKEIEGHIAKYNELQQHMERQNDESTKLATKQALGRRNIEAKLMEKDIELTNLKAENEKLKQYITIFASTGYQLQQQQQQQQQQQIRQPQQ